MAEAKKVYRTNKKNGITYIYMDEPYWDKDKKGSRHKMECIGKLAEDGVTEILNKRYLEKLEEQKKDEEPLLVSSTELIGEKLIIEQAIEKTGLKENLLKVFTPEDTDKYLTLASYQTCDGNAMAYAQEWSALRGYDVDICSQRTSELMARTSDDLVNTFFQEWINYNNSDRDTLFDITSVSSYDKNNEYVERGYNRDKENLKQVNIGLLTTYGDTIPLWYKILPGSISDINVLEQVVDSLKVYGSIDYSITGDKGFFSDSNLKYLYSNELQYMLPVPKYTDWVDEEIKKAVPTIRYEGDSIRDGEDSNFVYGVTKAITHKDYGEIWLHIYFDATRREADLDKFNIKLRNLQQKYKQKNGVKSKEDLAFCEKYFELYEADDIRIVTLNRQAIEEFQNTYTGTWAIITNLEATAAEALKYYRLRNEIELHFDDLKNTIDCKRLRTHTSATMKGKVFICFLSLILINEIKREVAQMNPKKIRNLTWKELLNACKTYGITHFVGKNKKDAYSIPTALQKNIFDEFGIDYVWKHKLTNGKTLNEETLEKARKKREEKLEAKK